MKKVGVIVVALVLLLCIGTVGAFAARGNGAGFIDANGDGICDNYGSRLGQKNCGGRHCGYNR